MLRRLKGFLKKANGMVKESMAIIDPRTADPAGIGHPDFSTLHYALATKVDGIVDRQAELSQIISSLASEVRAPKPIPWGSIITLVIGIFAVMGTIGGLVHQSISDRIAINSSSITAIEKKFDNYPPREEINTSLYLLRETAKRLEDVQIAQRKAEEQINVTKAEFNAVAQSIRDRQLRNENYIEEARKAEAVHTRINALYELYKTLQTQAHDELIKQIQLHDQIGQRLGTSK